MNVLAQEYFSQKSTIFYDSLAHYYSIMFSPKTRVLSWLPRSDTVTEFIDQLQLRIETATEEYLRGFITVVADVS